MPTPSNEITEAYADGFDAEREALLNEESQLVLLQERETGTTSSFKHLRTVSVGWSSGKNSQFFGNITFKVADISAEFGKDVRAATHFMVVGSKIPAFNNLLHEKAEAETAPPDGPTPFWKLRAKPLARRYVLPEP